MKRLPILLLLCCALTTSAFLAGEGRLIGTVLDSSSTPVAGATIVLTREGSQYRQEKQSDAKGRFSALFLDTVAPVVGDTLRLDFTLKPL